MLREKETHLNAKISEILAERQKKVQDLEVTM